MSKIEEYKSAKATAARIAQTGTFVLGKDSPSNDKHEFSAKFLDAKSGTIQVSISTGYGYYGSSSWTNAASEDFGRFVARAITACKADIVRRAVELAASDAEIARRAAEAEAREVLVETTA